MNEHKNLLSQCCHIPSLLCYQSRQMGIFQALLGLPGITHILTKLQFWINHVNKKNAKYQLEKKVIIYKLTNWHAT